MTDTPDLTVPTDALCTAVERPFRGRLFAYVPTWAGGGPTGPYRLSIVVAGERGHYPMSDHLAYGPRDQVRKVADALNRDRLKLPIDAVTGLIMQSLRGAETLRRRRRA